jgi:glycosyltransferase involved in cell wall biosynthesis
MRTTVIICAYTLDRWSDFTAAVDSVRRQIRPPLETILVIDRSKPLLQRAREAFPDLAVVANAHRGGLSGSRQTGAALARGEIIAFLDDDAVAAPDWLEQLEPGYEDPDVLGVGGLIEPDWVAARPPWFPAEFDWVVGCSYEGLPKTRTRVRNAIGANMSVRAEVLRGTGDWEPSLGRTYSDGALGSTAEETEFCIRAARLHPGGYWLYIPTATVRHRVPPERGTWSYFVTRCRVEGQAKALISRLEGASSGLQSERAYVVSVLPRAVARELRGALGGRRHGLARAAAIIAGVLVTGFEFVRTSCRRSV